MIAQDREAKTSKEKVLFDIYVHHSLEIPIAHLILRFYDYQSYGDAYMYASDGSSLDLKFWYILVWKDTV